MKIRISILKRIIREASDAATDNELSRRDELISVYSDVYKEKYGVRPRWMMDTFASMTDDEIEAELSALDDEPPPSEPEYDYSWESEFDPSELDPSEATIEPSDVEDLHPMENLPTKIPFKGGAEYDALGAGKGVHIWRPGQRKAAKKSYNRRLRHAK